MIINTKWKYIPEKEREALMRLTMCAREECGMCKYKDTCGLAFQRELATKNMNILADALRKTEPQTCGNRYYYSDVGVKCCDFEHDPTIPTTEACEMYEPKDEPQTDCSGCRHYTDGMVSATICNDCKRSYTDNYEPQTERSNDAE